MRMAMIVVGGWIGSHVLRRCSSAGCSPAWTADRRGWRASDPPPGGERHRRSRALDAIALENRSAGVRSNRRRDAHRRGRCPLHLRRPAISSTPTGVRRHPWSAGADLARARGDPMRAAAGCAPKVPLPFGAPRGRDPHRPTRGGPPLDHDARPRVRPDDPTTPFAGSTTRPRTPRDWRTCRATGRSGWSVTTALGVRVRRVRRRPQTRRRAERRSGRAAGARRHGPGAGSDRAGDLESLAYDETSDTLYAFSGSCCSSAALPTVFRFTRDGAGQPVGGFLSAAPTGSDFTGAAWNPVDGSSTWRRGPRSAGGTSTPRTPSERTIGVGDHRRSSGWTSRPRGRPVVVTTAERLYRMDGSPSGGRGVEPRPDRLRERDSRAVEVIADPTPSADQIYVADGYDGRASGDPLRYAISVFDVTAAATEGAGVRGAGRESSRTPGSRRTPPVGSGSGVATLGRSSLAHARVLRSALASDVTRGAGNCVLNDRPNTVSSTTTGTYTASLWVRSDRPGATLRLRLREFASGSLVRISTSSVALEDRPGSGSS